MKSKKKSCSLLLAGAATAMILGAGSAAAAVPGFYLSGTVGQSSADVGQAEQEEIDAIIIDTFNELGFDVVDGQSDLDKSDFGFELALGYQFSPYFAVEAAYVDLGDAGYEAQLLVDDGVDQFDAEAEVAVGASGPALSLVGIWPFGEAFALDVRAGAFFAKSKVKVGLELDGQSGSESESDSDTSMLYGAGVSWAVSDRTSLRLGYTHFADGIGDEYDVGRMSLGVKVSF